MMYGVSTARVRGGVLIIKTFSSFRVFRGDWRVATYELLQYVASKMFNDNSKYPWVHLTFLKIHSVLAAMAAAALSSLVSFISASPDPVPCFPLTMAQNGRLDV
jgi:hypothetical protein